MSSRLIIFLALIFSLNPSSSMAQPAQTIPKGLNGVIGIQAGDYTFKGFDQSDSMKILTQEISKRSEKDLDYFNTYVISMNQAFLEIIQERIYGPKGLKSLSDQSAFLNKTVNAETFLVAVNQYKVSKTELSVMINGASSIATAFPSQTDVSVGTVKTEIPGYGKVNFTPLKDFYEKQLSQLNEFVANLPHQLLLPNGRPHVITAGSGKGLVLDTDAFQLSPARADELRAEIRSLRTWDSNARQLTLIPYTTHIKAMVTAFIYTYGTSEGFRYDTPTELKMKREIEHGIDMFYGRSFLRIAYGIPLGVIGIGYRVEKFNTDFFLSPNNLKFYEEVLFNEKDLVEVEKSFENAYQAAKSRSQKVFGSETDLLDRLNSAFTFLQGKNRLAFANKIGLELLYWDLQEERALITDGLAGLRKVYNKRYKSSPEKIAYFSKLKDKYTQIIYPELAAKNEWSSAPISLTPGTTLYLVDQVRTAGQKMEDSRALALEKEAVLQSMQKLSKNEQNNRSKRLKDL